MAGYFRRHLLPPLLRRDACGETAPGRTPALVCRRAMDYRCFKYTSDQSMLPSCLGTWKENPIHVLPPSNMAFNIIQSSGLAPCVQTFLLYAVPTMAATSPHPSTDTCPSKEFKRKQHARLGVLSKLASKPASGLASWLDHDWPQGWLQGWLWKWPLKPIMQDSNAAFWGCVWGSLGISVYREPYHSFGIGQRMMAHRPHNCGFVFLR